MLASGAPFITNAAVDEAETQRLPEIYRGNDNCPTISN